MNKKIKKSSILVALGLILVSCGGVNNSSSSKKDSISVPVVNSSNSVANSSNSSVSSNNGNSNNVQISSVSTNNKEEQSSSSVHEELSGNHLVYDNFNKATDWVINNANPVYNAGLSLSNNDNKEITLVKRHISLIKDKNYKFVLNAKGTGSVKVELLNSGKENIINGMNTTYDLTSDSKDFSFIFTTLDNYENVYISITVNGSIHLSKVLLDRANLYGDYEAPIFYGINDVNLYILSKFNCYDGIKVVDNVDGDLTHAYEVKMPEGITMNGRNITFNAPGEYKFIYSCIDKEENKSIVERTVTVHETMPSGHEFIKNGNFDNGLDLWYNDALDGTDGKFTVVEENGNNVLKADINVIPAKGSYQPFPRLLYGKLGTQAFTDELVIEKDCSYTLSFRIKGSVARTFQVAVGEILDKQDAQGNWTYYFAQEASTYGWGLANRTITTEWQTYTIDFKMALDYTNLNGCILFCFGDCGDNPQIGTFYLDDVSLVKK